MSVNLGTAILFFYCIFPQRLAVGNECHREGQFVKVEPGMLRDFKMTIRECK